MRVLQCHSNPTHIKFSLGPFWYERRCNGRSDSCCNIPSGHGDSDFRLVPARCRENLPECPHCVHTAAQQYNQTYAISMRRGKKDGKYNELFTVIRHHRQCVYLLPFASGNWCRTTGQLPAIDSTQINKNKTKTQTQRTQNPSNAKQQQQQQR